ncbi:MAG: hypothetical protein EI684_14400 [Candidatus Viridilinea halotolerans]|uniref:YfhO family protein n=1 Tax=Candidatus Viridilinea halotolerans TaxID=2491704 RepID=A0A426TWM8_9CHLR|nr:MAG: hypothetical protein EI684_14400 [Candidatus Viridilinea halotolerans]
MDARRLFSLLWPLLFFCLLTLPMTWPLARHLGSGLTAEGDDLLQAWLFAWNSHAITSQPAALWDAPIFYPYPTTLAFTDNHILLALLTAPLTWLSGEPLLAYNLLIFASFALSGWAVFLLARETLSDRGMSPAATTWAALLAGAGFAFSAYRFAHFSHFQLLQTAWMLFALLFLRRLLRPLAAGGGRWQDALLCGIFAAVQVATTLYYGFFVALLLGGYAAIWGLHALWLRLRAQTPLPWRQAALGLLAAAVAGVAAWPFVLPYMRVYASLGIVRSVRELDGWSAPLHAYFTVPQENLLYGALAPSLRGAGEMVLAPGLLLLLLVFGGLARLLWVSRMGNGNATDGPHPPAPLSHVVGEGGQQRDTWRSNRVDLLFWPLLAFVAFVLSLGTGIRFERFGEPLPIPLPYLQLYNYVPGFGALRVPARWGLLVTLAVAMLAALALATLLAQRRPRTRILMGGLALGLVLLEQAAPPQRWLVGPELTAAPPVYAWLAQAEQDDIAALLELPVAAVPRGAALQQVIWRQWHGRTHWRPLVASYSGLMPFGSSDLLRRAQDLPAPAVVSFFRLSGIDTLVIHRDAYAPGEAEALIAGLLALPEVTLRAEVGSATVLRLAPDPRIAAISAAAGPYGRIYLSADERIPGVLPLALSRQLTAAGYILYGPGRTRFYPPLQTPTRGQTFAAGLLAAAEDPREHGFLPEELVWQAHSLALYAGDPQLVFSFGLAQQVPGWFHPHFPTTLTLQQQPLGLHVQSGDGSAAIFPYPALPQPSGAALQVEVDVASLTAQTLRVGAEDVALPPGLSTLYMLLPTSGMLNLNGTAGEIALLRVRVRQTSAATQGVIALNGLVVQADVAFAGETLSIQAHAAGVERLRLDVRGAAAYDDRPIRLLAGSQPLPTPGATLAFTFDLLTPTASWIESQEPAQDGRYIVYLKDAAQPESPGLPVAKFNLRAGQVVDAEAVPLPLRGVQ